MLDLVNLENVNLPLIKRCFNHIINNSHLIDLNGYHNISHLLSVASYADQLSKNLSEQERTELIIAALMHDYNHTGSKLYTDDVNIRFAIMGLWDFYDLNTDVIQFENFTKIASLIEITQFPYTVKTIDLTDEREIIIRDCDMCQLFDNNWFYSTVIGLAKEYGVTINKQIRNQISFLENLTFGVKSLQDMYIHRKEYLIRYLENILE